MTDPRRFLFAMVEGGGNVPPQLGVARALVERGHRVAVLADPAVEAEARAAGCAFSAFRHAPHHHMRSREADILRDWEPSGPKRQLERLGRQLLFGPAEAYARDVVEALEREPADAVAVDWMVPGLYVGAEAAGVPTASLVHHPFYLPTEGIPPFGLGLPPAKGPVGRLRDRTLRRLMSRQFDALGLEAVNGARSTFGLEPVSSVFEQLRRVPRILVLTSRAFDFGAPAAPGNTRYVGPRLDDPGWAVPWESPWPADHPDPLVVVGLGSTFQDQGKLLQRIVEALSTLPLRVLLTLGDVFEPSSFPDNERIVAVRSAPHGAVLPHARLVVTHGGHGTLIKALAHGVPVLCIPLGRDQKDNAVRARVTGAGLRLPATASARRIRRAVRRLLHEPRFVREARRLATAIRDEIRDDAAVRELESLAREGRGVVRPPQSRSLAAPPPGP